MISPPQPLKAHLGRFACIRPQLFVDLETGEVVWGRCHATTDDLCPGCAALYRADAKVRIRSGMAQHLEAGDPVTFVTLTPPGLWIPAAAEELRKTHRYYPASWELRHDPKVNAERLCNRASRAVCGPCTEAARAARPPGTRVRDVPAVSTWARRASGPQPPPTGSTSGQSRWGWGITITGCWYTSESRSARSTSRVGANATSRPRLMRATRSA